MTAVVIIRQRAAVHVLTDGMAYTPYGLAQGYRNKIELLPHLGNAVLAFRGPGMFLSLFAIYAGSLATSFEDLRMRIVDLLRGCISDLADQELRAELLNGGFEFFAAAGASAQGPTAFAVGNWVVQDVPDVCFAPWSAEMQADMFKQIKPGTPPDDLDPVRHGVAIFECQRRHPVQHGPYTFRRFVSVGGFVQLATTNAEGISTRIIHRWPDDEILVPALQAVDSAPIAGCVS